MTFIFFTVLCDLTFKTSVPVPFMKHETPLKWKENLDYLKLMIFTSREWGNSYVWWGISEAWRDWSYANSPYLLKTNFSLISSLIEPQGFSVICIWNSDFVEEETTLFFSKESTGTFSILSLSLFFLFSCSAWLESCEWHSLPGIPSSLAVISYILS